MRLENEIPIQWYFPSYSQTLIRFCFDLIHTVIHHSVPFSCIQIFMSSFGDIKTIEIWFIQTFRRSSGQQFLSLFPKWITEFLLITASSSLSLGNKGFLYITKICLFLWQVHTYCHILFWLKKFTKSLVSGLSNPLPGVAVRPMIFVFSMLSQIS